MKMIEPDITFIQKIVEIDYDDNMMLLKYDDDSVLYKITHLNNIMIKLNPDPELCEINHNLVIIKHNKYFHIFLYYRDYMIFRHELEPLDNNETDLNMVSQN